MTLLAAELLLLYLIVELRTRRYKTAGIDACYLFKIVSTTRKVQIL
jgi:hypothetical protein